MKDYIVVLNDGVCYPGKGMNTAQLLADGFQKKICLLSFVSPNKDTEVVKKQHADWIKQFNLNAISEVRSKKTDQLHDVLSELEAAFLILDISSGSMFKKTQPLLNICKPLRIPYIFVTALTEPVSLHRALVPVRFLTEEKEKGILASKLARFCNTSITLLQARDFGSKTTTNINGIKTLFEKLQITCEIKQARKDSFKVQNEAALQASAGDADIVLITSSREYGLDDIIFGPPERKIIQQSKVPVMILNPRRDIYVLCD